MRSSQIQLLQPALLQHWYDLVHVILCERMPGDQDLDKGGLEGGAEGWRCPSAEEEVQVPSRNLSRNGLSHSIYIHVFES